MAVIDYQRRRQRSRRFRWRPLFVSMFFLGVIVYGLGLLVEVFIPTLVGETFLIIGILGWLFCWAGPISPCRSAR